ncbi:MAG TPA: sensor histidine kinase [Streptosporangiaceae bacterium]
MRVLIDQAVAGGRRVTGAPDWPTAAAVLLGLFAMVEVVYSAPRGDPGELDAQSPGAGLTLTVALLLALGATLPLALWRTSVVAAAATVTVANLLTLAGDALLTVTAVAAQLIVLYLLGLYRPRRVALPFVLPYAVYAVAPYGGSIDDRHVAVLLLALTVAAVVLGSGRRAHREAVERDASRQAMADSLLEHAARGERARIARELHDVVAHHISMIAVQAETARLATAGMPAEGQKRLLAIGDTARAALTEMRRLLGVLREDAGTETTRKPQPGLEQLNELIDEARDSAAASTRLIVRGNVTSLDPGIELTAYRIVQEALTNARRHAPGAAVDVELDYAGAALRLRVRDNGPGPPGDGSDAGHGLLGMRERAAMVGGALSTGPGTAGGFVVEATLPTPRQDAE